jgi:hypothetical protein
VKDDGISFRVVGVGTEAGNMQSISDLNAVTDYSVQIMVKNDREYQANKTITYTTGELGKLKS